MTAANYDDHLVRDARLIILKALAKQTDGRLNEALLTIELDRFGHRRSREWVRTQLLKLQELGAIVVQEHGSVMIAGLTRLGLAHVERREMIDGVAKPSPEF
jgi:ATP/maltotriose-dependent transcriptional regulator MalT